MRRANCKRSRKDCLAIIMDSNFFLSDETNKRRLWNIWKKGKLFTVLWCEELTSREGWKDFLLILMDSTFLLSAETNKWRLWNIWKKEKIFTVLWCAELFVREGGRRTFYQFSWILTSCSQLNQTNNQSNKQTNFLRYQKKEKFFTVLWCAELTVREGGKKDFLPILMDPEKQGEEPRKVYVTSRWPIHNLWGGATMLLSFVHQAHHSPCSPLSTKKKPKSASISIALHQN